MELFETIQRKRVQELRTNPELEEPVDRLRSIEWVKFWLYVDKNFYTGEDWLGHWMAHELGHLATNSVLKSWCSADLGELYAREHINRFCINRAPLASEFNGPNSKPLALFREILWPVL